MIPTLGLSLKALKKEPFSGSHCGMRYYLITENDTLIAYFYPEPWCFEATQDDQKEKKEFPFTQEGLDEAISWMNQRYESDRDNWERISKEQMRILLET